MKNSENLFYSFAKIGGIQFKVFTSKKGVRKIFMNNKDGKIKRANLTRLYQDDPYMFNIFNELTEYFGGERKKFTVPFDINGTDFEKKAWQELRKILYGKTSSYKSIAERLGNVNAVRAVGRVIGLNPIPIIIPCHRVINFNGNLGGYSCGLEIKEKLLELEGSLSLELFE